MVVFPLLVPEKSKSDPQIANRRATDACSRLACMPHHPHASHS